jgi:enoyl-[acyl-carrier protein] reductase II
MPADAFRGVREVYFTGDMEAAPALAGQTVGLIHEVKSAQEIIAQTVDQFFAISQRLAGLASSRTFG